MNVFKVQPKEFTDPALSIYRITGVVCKVVELPFSLTERNPVFYFAFVDENGVTRASRNATRPEFIAAIQETGATVEQATAQADAVISGLLSLEPAERYAAAAQLASLYAYEAVPFAEQ